MPCLPQKVWQSRFLAEFGISGIVCNSCIWWISSLQSTFQYSCPTTLITVITSSNISFCLEVIEAVRSVDGIGLLFGGWDTAAHWDIPMAEGSQHPAAGKYQCHWRHCDSVTRLNYTQLNAMVLRSWLGCSCWEDVSQGHRLEKTVLLWSFIHRMGSDCFGARVGDRVSFFNSSCQSDPIVLIVWLAYPGIGFR